MNDEDLYDLFEVGFGYFAAQVVTYYFADSADSAGFYFYFSCFSVS